ncbi:MAG: hypothetical protein ACD_79C01012G0003 [uncultured bacterium]|nr:MAG: hypothetical protein ACD_79C01012G0003 [uncultured bacterium]
MQTINKALNYPIDRTISILGIETSKTGRFPCPFHSSPKPTMSVIRSKNRCFCSECKKEASSIDIAKKIMGYSDTEAIEFLLSSYALPGKIKITSKKEASIINNSSENKSEILSDFYWNHCVDISNDLQVLLTNTLGIDKNLLTNKYLKRSPLSYDNSINILLNKWKHAELLHYGIIENSTHNHEFFLNEPNFVFPHFEYRADKQLSNYPKTVRMISCIKVKDHTFSKRIPESQFFWPYNMDKIDWSRKILFCENTLGVLAILSHSNIYSPISIIYENIDSEFIDMFTHSEITIVIEHKSHNNDNKENSYTDVANKIITMLNNKLNYSLNVMRIPKGMDIIKYFSQFKSKYSI